MSAEVRLLLVDDHEVVRRGLANLFEADGSIEVVASVGTVSDGLVAAAKSDADVAVLDVRLPDGSGLDLCRELVTRHPGLKCLMLTSFADDHAMVEASDAGAAAYLLKELGTTDIVGAVKQVAAGAQLLDAAEVRMAQRRIKGSDEGIVDALTPQEHKIFELLGSGLTNRQIADEMCLAEKTVKNYITNMLAKLDMTRRTEVAALAARVEERHRKRYE
ncbi:MAG: response regulator [Acidimicrobiales bacterium]